MSIDSIFVGVSYGIKGTKIPNTSKLIICIFSVIYSAISIASGNLLANIIPTEMVKIFGALILALIGLAMIIKVLKKKNQKSNNNNTDEYLIAKQQKTTNASTNFANSLDLTMQILQDPDAGDVDKSGIIDKKESLLLGTALSIDALGAGIGSSFLGMGRWYVPLAIGIFQLLFLCAGLFVGKYCKKNISLKEEYMSVISGVILIGFSIFKLM